MIVLAGGIGSGKSVVARILRLQGFGVYDCDLEARRLMEKDAGLVETISFACCFPCGKGGSKPEKVYDAYGKLDRKKLASLIFSDKEIRGKVNKAVHAAVKADIRKWLALSPENIFVETAIPAESGLAYMADEVWLVEASLETRLQRVKERDNRTEEEIMRIIQAQRREELLMEENAIPLKRIPNNPGDSLLKVLADYIRNINKNK